MEEAILSSVAEGIIGQLANAAVKEIALLWGVEDELEQLEDTISTIKSVLVDAEKQQLQHQQIKTWLMRLEDAVYDADDLVDEFSTEALRRQVMAGHTKAKQVRVFCSTSNQFAFRHKMGKKIRDLRKKLDKIANDRKFHLEMGLQDTQVVTGLNSPTTVREEDVIGRDDEKMEIMKRLFDIKTEEHIGVIPIVGIGGLGKTTLAHLVIKDAKVNDHFELIMWVNAPKVFEAELVVKEIIKSGEKGERSIDNIPMHQLQRDLREKIKGKKYLFVLDDVWEIKNREKWLELENLLRDGANGSKIIVTTRDKMVACIINGRRESAYLLGTLDEEKSWSLFKKLAFMQGEEQDNPNHVEIGRQIMKKCGGIPLVIRTIGSMLYSINLEEWSSFKEKELSTISQYDEDIIPRLKLSYDHLPSYLKHCFAYCSLFPKNHIINVEKLINLWMAQGFIKLSNQHLSLEEMGYQHFKDLLYRSFFEEVEIDDFYNVTKCKMHDCMHDLAMSVTGRKGVILSLNDDDKINEKTRHVSLNFSLDSRQQFPALLVKTKRLRTILLVQHLSSRRLEKSILSFKLLRTLDLHRMGLQIIPTFIGKLKHLRYLDLSFNYMKTLPDSITKLQNLQTLNLCGCRILQALPRDITKLVNLRHLDTRSCRRLTHMPCRLGQLTNLQMLSVFPLKEDSGNGGQLNELKNLNNLRGNLDIVVEKDGIESKGADLKNKEYLQSLELSIWGRMVDDCEDLVPHQNLKQLRLSGPCVTAVLLNCASSLQNLVKFELREHKKCRYIAVLNHLPYLKVVEIRQLPALEYISNEDCHSSLPFFPSLQQLYLKNIPNLKGWWKVDADDVGKNENKRILPFFPRLSQLWIIDCPKLSVMPLFPYLREELYLESTSIKPFQETLMMKMNIFPLSKLKTLNIDNVQDLQYFSVGFKSLTSLKKLKIEQCSNLQSLSPGIHHLTSLQLLDISGCEELDMMNGSDANLWQHLGSLSDLSLEKLPKLVELPHGLQQVTSLQSIQILGCENLKAVPKCISNLKSLKNLHISNCPSLKSLPEGIDCDTSLQQLEI